MRASCKVDNNLKHNLINFYLQRDALSTYLENVAHPASMEIKQVVPVRLEMPWRTNHNKIDCGVFVMRHMETYKVANGKSWECRLSNKFTDTSEIRTNIARKLMI
ncbi:hypothetical protein Hanom_Chr05g00403541 [Helianthus anomalus]